MRWIRTTVVSLVLCALGAVALPNTALAWSGQVSGVIFELDGTDGEIETPSHRLSSIGVNPRNASTRRNHAFTLE